MALGCLGVFVVVALIVAALGAWYLRLPEQWGLVESPAEEYFEGSPNPWAKDYLKQDFENEGVSTEGIMFAPMPRDEGDSHTAYILIDESEGASWSHSTYPNPIEGALIIAATGDAASLFDIERVAVDYRDASGAQVAVMTAPTDALVAFDEGTISQEELFAQMNGRTPDSAPISIGGGE
jgi:hypothetical protein